MKQFLSTFIYIFGCASIAHSQIYADFNVSQGTTNLGTFRVRLDYDKAPRACANFIGLATGERAWIDPANGNIQNNKKYYDGIIFHRLIHNFVIQGGDPLGTGTGGPGYVFQDQFDPSLLHNGRYKLSMAHAGTNTNGSQFFITLEQASSLDFEHTVFGEVINDTTFPASRTIIDNFANSTTFPTTQDRPLTDVKINSVTITRVGAAANAFNIHDPSLLLPIVKGLTPTGLYTAGIFRLSWPTQEKRNYKIYNSFDLQAWSLFRNGISLNQNPANTLDIPDLTNIPKLFIKITETDYSNHINAPTVLLSSGRKLTIQQFNSTNNLELTFNGSTGGAWADTTGASGIITNITWGDSAPSTGFFVSAGNNDQSKFIPLGNLNFTINNGAAAGWTAMNLGLDFQSTTTGYFQSNSVNGSTFNIVRGTFTLSP